MHKTVADINLYVYENIESEKNTSIWKMPTSSNDDTLKYIQNMDKISISG